MSDFDNSVRDRPPLVYMYHSVSTMTGSDPNYLRVHPDRLAEQLRYLQRRGRRGVSMSYLLNAVRVGSGSSLVGLTFDDGYADFAEQAVSVLDRFGFTATVFVVSGRLSDDNGWDRPPRLPLMSPQQIRAVRTAGHEVGSHSSRHVRLKGLPPADLTIEVAESRRQLEDLLGKPVVGFCYPYGSFDAAAMRCVEEAGYNYACATTSYESAGLYCLPRTFVGQRDRSAGLRAKELRHWARSTGLLR